MFGLLTYTQSYRPFSFFSVLILFSQLQYISAASTDSTHEIPKENNYASKHFLTWPREPHHLRGFLDNTVSWETRGIEPQRNRKISMKGKVRNNVRSISDSTECFGLEVLHSEDIGSTGWAPMFRSGIA